MKKPLSACLLLVAISLPHAQSKTDLAGTYKIVVKQSGPKANFKTTPAYLLLKADGTYIWGIDSTAAEPLKGTSKGKWEVTADKEIKIVPEPGGMPVRYYVNTGGKSYMYRYGETDGKKTPVQRLEIDEFLEKQ